MSTKRVLIALALVCAVAIFFVFDLGRSFDFDVLKANRVRLAELASASPVRAGAIFVAVYIAVTALSLPGAAVMTLGAGALFGVVWGTLLVSVASTIGATLAFLMSRFVLRGWVAERFANQLDAVDRGIERDGALYLFTLRLVPAFPFFVVNLLMGLTSLRTRTFFWVSQAGMLAGTVVFVNAGTRLAELGSLGDVLSAGVLGSLALLGVLPLAAKKLSNWLAARRIYSGWKKPKRFDRNMVVIGAASVEVTQSIHFSAA